MAPGIRVFMLVAVVAAPLADGAGGLAQTPARGEKWVASWAASPHGPYPSGNPSAQPDLTAAFETADGGAVDQTFRLIVKPDLWGRTARLRLTNVFGTRPVRFDDVFVGLQSSGGNVTAGTNRPVRFAGGKTEVTIAGRRRGDKRRDRSELRQERSRSVAGRPEARRQLPRRRFDRTHDVARQGAAPPRTSRRRGRRQPRPRRKRRGLLVHDDFLVSSSMPSMSSRRSARWLSPASATRSPTAPRRRSTATTAGPTCCHAACTRSSEHEVSVVNAGIGGNRVVSPVTYSPASPVPGGPSALERFDRDVAGLSGVYRQ